MLKNQIVTSCTCCNLQQLPLDTSRIFHIFREHFMEHLCVESGILGARYLVFVSSHSLKTRELSFAQFVYFLREVCLSFKKYTTFACFLAKAEKNLTFCTFLRDCLWYIEPSVEF